jgi:hypothetical protein
MDWNTLLTHGLTYLAALALPLWLLGEQLAAWWTLRRPTIERLDAQAPLDLAHLDMEDEAEEVRKAA